ncbi:MAG: hypothetical protein JWM09_837 [Francisellaceae bacterium]|nr:hypothetical protein [Francisellaceae bacterium]
MTGKSILKKMNTLQGHCQTFETTVQKVNQDSQKPFTEIINHLYNNLKKGTDNQTHILENQKIYKQIKKSLKVFNKNIQEHKKELAKLQERFTACQLEFSKLTEKDEFFTQIQTLIKTISESLNKNKHLLGEYNAQYENLLLNYLTEYNNQLSSALPSTLNQIKERVERDLSEQSIETLIQDFGSLSHSAIDESKAYDSAKSLENLLRIRLDKVRTITASYEASHSEVKRNSPTP